MDMARLICWWAIALLITSQLSAHVSVEATCSGTGGDATYYPSLYQTPNLGEATYYGAYTGGGACTLDPTPFAGSNTIFTTVAIADNVWKGSEACGMCIEITANGQGSGGSPLNGNYLVYVNNECPSCSNNGIDLGLSGDGAWDISWVAVPCPVGSTYFQYLFQGSNPYYIKLQVRNTRYPVASVSIQQSGTWHALVRTADNFWGAGSSVTFPVSTPITIQVTSVTGDSVTDTVASITNGVVMTGIAQFPTCASSSTATTATTATTSTSATATATSTTSSKSATTTATSATSSKSATTTATSATSSKSSTTTATSTTSKSSTTTSTTAKSTTTTTGSPGSSSYIIYDDALENGFQDWSWATRSLTNTNPVYAGLYSISFTEGDYTGLYFVNPTAFTLSSFSYIVFYVNGGSLSNVPLGVSFVDANHNLIGTTVSISTAVVANTWVAESISISSFEIAVGTQVTGLQIQYGSASGSGTFYIDDIYLAY